MIKVTNQVNRRLQNSNNVLSNIISTDTWFLCLEIKTLAKKISVFVLWLPLKNTVVSERWKSTIE